MIRVIQTLCLVVLALPVFAASAPPLTSDRPTQSFRAATVAAGQTQHELGYTHDRTDGVTVDTLGEWLFRWGVARDLEFRVLVGSVAWLDVPDAGRTHGWTDSGVGLKWTSQRGAGPRPTAALLLGTSLPTGGSAFGEDTLQPEAVVVMEWALSRRVNLGTNVAWAWASHDLERFDRWWGSLVLRVDLGKGFDLFGEGYGYRREVPGGSSTGYLDAGVAYRVADRVALDARVGLGRNGLDDDWLVGVGVTWRLAGD